MYHKPPHTRRMNYKAATLQHMFRRAPKKNTLAYTMSQLPKGWIYIKKDGTYHDTMSEAEREEHRAFLFDMEFRHQASIFTNRFVQNTRDDLERACYTPDEIDAYLEEMFYVEEEDANEQGIDVAYPDEYESDESR